jgi:hypothetical protein
LEALMFRRLRDWWEFWMDFRAFMKELKEAKNTTTSNDLR